MNKQIEKIFYKISFWVYKIIGPDKSTHLAYSPLGRLIFFILKRNNRLKLYTAYKGIKVKLNFEDAFNSGFLFLGAVNINETKVLETILKKGDVVIDVGAYVDGWYTLFPSMLVGNTGHVYSFEPCPAYFESLKKNVELNKFSNITLIEKGLSDKEEKVPFYVSSGASSIIKKHIGDVKGKLLSTVKIKTTTIDKFVKDLKIKRIDLIKIDVEGVEMKVLKGAAKTLKEMNYPNLIVEIVDEFLNSDGSGEKEVLKFLSNMKYKPYYFTSEGLKFYKFGDKKRTANIFFTKR